MLDLTPRRVVSVALQKEFMSSKKFLKNKFQFFIIFATFQLSGRRPVTTIVSRGGKIFLIVSVFPLRDELDFVHQITDNYTLTDQFYPKYDSETIFFVYNFLLKSKIICFTAKIMVLVFYKLMIKSKTHDIYIHDGPGTFSKRLNLNRSWVNLSSNQAYCKFYSIDDRKSIIEARELLDFYAIQPDVVHVHVFGKKSVMLPPCSAKPLQDSVNDELNLHCIYNITSTSGYVNLSISELALDGFNWKSIFYECFLGGAAFTFELIV